MTQSKRVSYVHDTICSKHYTYETAVYSIIKVFLFRFDLFIFYFEDKRNFKRNETRAVRQISACGRTLYDTHNLTYNFAATVDPLTVKFENLDASECESAYAFQYVRLFPK